jgi:hypothetical protein
MAFNPEDYAGDTYERDAAEARERRQIAFEEREAREELERIACAEADFYSELYPAQIHEPDPVAIALAGWMRSQRIATATPGIAAIGNGLFVRVGTGRKRRAA